MQINTTLFALAEQEHSSSDKELPPQAPSQDPGLNFGQNLKAPQSKAEPAKDSWFDSFFCLILKTLFIFWNFEERWNQLELKNERNQTAILILKRIQQKLDGHDPDENLQKSLSDQVDHVISEARAIHNLALMYEGWTSWVWARDSRARVLFIEFIVSKIGCQMIWGAIFSSATVFHNCHLLFLPPVFPYNLISRV